MELCPASSVRGAKSGEPGFGASGQDEPCPSDLWLGESQSAVADLTSILHSDCLAREPLSWQGDGGMVPNRSTYTALLVVSVAFQQCGRCRISRARPIENAGVDCLTCALAFWRGSRKALRHIHIHVQ